ncbi:hypothetical protein BJ170DRAFT_648495, partial [Xylariales sp. AK1849]
MESGLPYQSDETYEIDHALNELFIVVLDSLAETDVFSRSNSPSLFIVYAHDNGGKVPAYGHCVHHLISWLKAIRSRLLSDKSPLPLWSDREGGAAAAQNILSNQLCLLPASSSIDTGTINTVDKVVVCGSPLLEQYYKDDFTSSYIKDIEELYAKTQHQTREVLQSGIRDCVENRCDSQGFHHVLTELAFLRTRRSYKHDNHGIIPIALDGVGVTYLPFLDKCDLFLKLKSHTSLPPLHGLFFNLLRQLYTDQHPLIDHFQRCYDEASTKLQTENAVTRTKFENIVRIEIVKTQDALIRLGSAAIRDETTRELKSHIGSASSRLDRILKRTNFLRGLSTLPYRDRKDRNPERVDGTCGWFTDHPLFRTWQDSTISSLLWVSADPGCGKSVLAKHLVDNVLPTTSTRTTCYFFFKDDFEDQRNVEGALRCILHQLFKQRDTLLSDKVLKMFEEDGQLLTSFTGLWDILTSIASSQDSGEIICILDALDECQESGRSRLAKALNKFYENEQSKSTLKFLLTSRPYSYIQRDFQVLKDRRPTIHLSGENPAEVKKISREIDVFIRAKVKEVGIVLQLQDEEEHVLRDELTCIPNRTYLWVYLIFDAIRNTIDTSKAGLLASIHELPRTVEAAYEKILGKSHDSNNAKRLLHIVVAAERPLSLQEMATALAMREDYRSYDQLEREPEDRFRKTIRELCGLFVTIVDSRLYLLHQTAREFLIYKTSSDPPSLSGRGSPSRQWQNSLRPMESNRVLADICIWCLSLENNGPIFLDYAAENWAVHFRMAQSMNTETMILGARRLCDTTSQRCMEWFRIYWNTTGLDFPEGITPLIIASYFGLEE